MAATVNYTFEIYNSEGCEGRIRGCTTICTQKGTTGIIRALRHSQARFFTTVDWDVSTMAGRAILWRGLVEENRFVGDDFVQFVTIVASHVLVCATQGERGPLFVIEQRGLPFRAVVAVGAWGSVAFGDELLSVNVLVAVLALHRGGLEIHIDQLGFEVWRFVAVDACRRPVCSEQGELGLGMIESGEFLPRLGAMADLATGLSFISAELLHALLELAFMGIVVTTGAVEALPAIDDGWFGLELGRFFVALGARYGDVAAGQHKPSFLMLGESEG